MRDRDPPVLLAELTSEEAGDEIAAADFVALPTGSHEQHSLHLPLSTDSLLAGELTRELARAAPDHGLHVPVLPAVTYGYSEHHMNYPGTVTLTSETFRNVVVEVGESIARHGADRLLIVNHHGGNRHPLALAADRLQRERDLPTHVVHWPDFAREEIDEQFGEEWGHAGDYETSGIEHFDPDLVKSDAKEPQTRKAEYETRSWSYFDETTEQGGLGDPTNADPEALASIVESTTADLAESLAADLERASDDG